MKIEKLTKDNIHDFIKDVVVSDDIISNINKLEYFAIKGDDTYYIGFEMLPEDDKIAIRFINKKLKDEVFMECISYLKNNMVVKNHLILEVFDEKYMKLMDDVYRCKDALVSLNIKDENKEASFKEKYAEIDMLNIKYFYSKREIVCNLVKQNIQDENIIVRLHDYFTTLGSDIISFYIYDNCYEILKNIKYKYVYKSYVL